MHHERARLGPAAHELQVDALVGQVAREQSTEEVRGEPSGEAGLPAEAREGDGDVVGRTAGVDPEAGEMTVLIDRREVDDRLTEADDHSSCLPYLLGEVARSAGGGRLGVTCTFKPALVRKVSMAST